MSKLMHTRESTRLSVSAAQEVGSIIYCTCTHPSLKGLIVPHGTKGPFLGVSQNQKEILPGGVISPTPHPLPRGPATVLCQASPLVSPSGGTAAACI